MKMCGVYYEDVWGCSLNMCAAAVNFQCLTCILHQNTYMGALKGVWLSLLSTTPSEVAVFV